MSDLKNVVIVGAQGGAIAAQELAKSLPATHRVVLIERNDFAYWPIGSLRASVKAGAEDTVFAPLDKVFPKDSRHIVLPSTEVVELGPDSIKVNRTVDLFGGDVIPVDYAIVATGSNYSSPSRPLGRTREEAKAALRAIQADIEKATSVLVVGGGATGVEFAGEVHAVHPTKKVTLVHGGEQLVAPQFKAALSQRLVTQLKAANVNLHLGTKVTIPEDTPLSQLLPEPRSFKTSKGIEVEADFVFFANGGSPNVSLFPASALGSSGRAAVDPKTLQLLDPSLGGRYFVVGDANDAPTAKTYFATTRQDPVAAQQVLAKIQGKPTKAAFKDPGNMIVVPFGPSKGASQVFFLTLGEWFTVMAKSKTLLEPMFRGVFGNF